MITAQCSSLIYTCASEVLSVENKQQHRLRIYWDDVLIINLFTGTELTKANIHTADGISVRFPRVTRIRNDKDWQTATNLQELVNLYKTSKEKTDVSLLNKLAATAESDEPPSKKMKESPKKDKINTLDTFIKKDISPKQNTVDNIKKEKIKKEMNTSSSSVSDTSSSTIIDESANDIDDEEPDLQLLPNNPLPDVFLNKKLGFYPDFISFSEEEQMFFERHWIAYGGEVIKSIRFLDVDYVVHNRNNISFKNMQKLIKKVPKNARHVTKEWLNHCIHDIKLYNTEEYPVFVEPES